MPFSGELERFLVARNDAGLKAALQSLLRGNKGPAFEELLAELYRGNGWLVQVQGGRGDGGADILLFHPKTTSRISLIVQAKNHALPLTFDQTRLELIKFEEKARDRYNCQNFRLVSVSGYVREAGKLGDFNMLLDGWEHVTELVERYDSQSKTEPQIELFAHNRTTYDRIKTLWEETDQVAVVQATGTGKSFLIAKVLADFLDKRKIVLAPSNYILEQQQSKVPWLSDTTDYMTYAKLGRMSTEKIATLCYELIVLDEFHRCGAEVWGAGMQRLLDTLPEAKVLGTSATPVRYLDNERDMAEELFDGVVAVDLSLAEAIVRRILPAPTYISALYALDEEIAELLAEIDTSRRSEEEKAGYREEVKNIRLNWERTSGVPEILKAHLPVGVDKLIVFCRDQQHLDEMEIEVQRWFLKAGTHAKRKTYRVLSSDPESARNLEAFKKAGGKGTVHLLFAIDMLNEGLHIPEVGAVILLRPTISPIIFYQQIGRCIEVGKDHEPVIFDLVNNFRNVRANDLLADLEDARAEEAQRRTGLGLPAPVQPVNIKEFTRPVEEIFELIRNRLSSWESMFQKLSEYKNDHGHCNVPLSFSENPPLGTWVNTQRVRYRFGRIKIAQIEKLESIGFIWDPSDSYWEAMFEELMEYWKIHGHSDVPITYKANPSLAIWVGTQRTRYYRDRLSNDKIRRLEQLDFSWKPRDKKWDIMFSALCKYSEEYGHCNVSSDDPATTILGRWVRKQRSRRETLNNERVTRLESLGFAWDPIDTAWEKLFSELCAYKEKHGDCDVPGKYSQNPALGAWVGRLRTSNRKGLLAENVIKRLNDFDFNWDPNSTTWQQMYDALCTYKFKNGNCLVPARYPENPGLGVWVGTQRLALKKERLNTGQVQQLNEIGFVWEPYEAQWAEKYKELCEYLSKHGNCRVPDKYPENPSLGVWVVNQRMAKKNGKLTDDMIRQLELIGFEWDVYAAQWERMYDALHEFKNNHGHTNVPYKYSPNPMLSRWVNTQRINRKRDRLSPEAINKLDELGFDWVPTESSAESMFLALGEFKDKYGHCNVPRDYPENPGLAVWVSTRRAFKRNGRLSAEQLHRLDSMGFEWSPNEEAWESNFAALCSFRKQNGHCNVPQSYLPLGRWVSKQRQRRRNGALSEEKVKRLDAIGFVWEPKRTGT